MMAQPARVIAALVAVGPSHHKSAGHVDLGEKRAHVGCQVGHVEARFPGLGMMGLGMMGIGPWTIVAQPQEMVAPDVASAPGDAQDAALDLDTAQAMGNGIDVEIRCQRQSQSGLIHDPLSNLAGSALRPVPVTITSGYAPNPVKYCQKRLMRLVELMQASLEEPLAIAAICRAADVPDWRARRLIRRYLGRPPVAYCRHLRLERARHLLSYGYAPIKLIAVAYGFEDRAAFSNAFKAAFGARPSRYRRARTGAEGLDH